VIQLLNQTLACTVDLRSHVKQAGWNVRGPDVAPLQALFATLASELEAYADLGGGTDRGAGGDRAGSIKQLWILEAHFNR
jgi:starvation-inducible DNA-binding protein